MRDRINITVDPADLAEIDRAAAAAGVTRSAFLVASALGRARGRLDVADALAVIQTALERAGEL